MLIIEIGNNYIKLSDEKNHLFSRHNLKKDIIDEGSIINIPEVFELVKKNVDVSQEEIAFILDSKKIISKEVSYPIYRKSKTKVLIGLSIKEHFPDIDNNDYVFSYEVLEKTRYILYAAPKVLIDGCLELAKLLKKEITVIDYGDNVFIKYLKEVSKKEIILFINIKDNITIIGILKDGILKLQSTISNGTIENLLTSTSRIIKYYSDKNNREHIRKVFVLNKIHRLENIAEEFSKKMLLEVCEVNHDEIGENSVGKGNLNFAENVEIKDKGISRYFSVYRLAIIFSIGIFLYFIAPPTLELFYTVSEKNELQGDFDAIDDIIGIIQEEELAKAKLEMAKDYQSIIEALPDDCTELEVNDYGTSFLITGKFISNIDENAIRKINENVTLFLNDTQNTFIIENGMAGDKN